jgi:hypothetical protein
MLCEDDLDSRDRGDGSDGAAEESLEIQMRRTMSC